jgi:hypothetical protein
MLLFYGEPKRKSRCRRLIWAPILQKNGFLAMLFQLAVPLLVIGLTRVSAPKIDPSSILPTGYPLSLRLRAVVKSLNCRCTVAPRSSAAELVDASPALIGSVTFLLACHSSSHSVNRRLSSSARQTR